MIANVELVQMYTYVLKYGVTVEEYFHHKDMLEALREYNTLPVYHSKVKRGADLRRYLIK